MIEYIGSSLRCNGKPQILGRNRDLDGHGACVGVVASHGTEDTSCPRAALARPAQPQIPWAGYPTPSTALACCGICNWHVTRNYTSRATAL